MLAQSTDTLRCYDACSPFLHESAFDMRQFHDYDLRVAYWDLKLGMQKALLCMVFTGCSTPILSLPGMETFNVLN